MGYEHEQETKNLCSAIILRAIKDLKNNRPGSYLYKDAEAFFNTDWFEAVAEGSGVDAGIIRKRVAKMKQEKAVAK